MIFEALQKSKDELAEVVASAKHDWKYTECHPYNGGYWYKCSKCGAEDWIPHNGNESQLKPTYCQGKQL